jgi:hypothetical protein
MRNGEPGSQRWNNEPGKIPPTIQKLSHDHPDFFIGYIKTAGCKAANEMINDTEYYLHG